MTPSLGPCVCSAQEMLLSFLGGIKALAGRTCGPAPAGKAFFGLLASRGCEAICGPCVPGSQTLHRLSSSRWHSSISDVCRAGSVHRL